MKGRTMKGAHANQLWLLAVAMTMTMMMMAQSLTAWSSTLQARSHYAVTQHILRVARSNWDCVTPFNMQTLSLFRFLTANREGYQYSEKWAFLGLISFYWWDWNFSTVKGGLRVYAFRGTCVTLRLCVFNHINLKLAVSIVCCYARLNSMVILSRFVILFANAFGWNEFIVRKMARIFRNR